MNSSVRFAATMFSENRWNDATGYIANVASIFRYYAELGPASLDGPHRCHMVVIDNKPKIHD